MLSRAEPLQFLPLAEFTSYWGSPSPESVVDQARLDGCTVSAGDTTYTSGNNKITLAAGLLHLQLPRALHKWHEDHRGHPIDYVC
uniref:Uncharacterized protein n=1 Tax=Oryza meridionalis TaxID=40149 RepID=A0A0E0CIN3_9ORYZ